MYACNNKYTENIDKSCVMNMTRDNYRNDNIDWTKKVIRVNNAQSDTTKVQGTFLKQK